LLRDGGGGRDTVGRSAVGEYAPVTGTVREDWTASLLSGATRLEVPALGRNPVAWPEYAPKQAVTVWRLARGPVAAVWDFAAYGGSFGEDDATALVEAARRAVAERRPLVTVVRSGGTRLQEGIAALVGIPRARLALLDLAAAGLAHLSVADAPTTGGVWISVASAADVRVAVEGATVGFAGPRVVQAVTGVLPAEGSHTAGSAYAAGLVDAVLPGPRVPDWLDRALTALTADSHESRAVRVPPAPHVAPPTRSGWAQVERARARTVSGEQLLDRLLSDRVPLRAPGGDRTVAACVGRLSGRPVVAVALAARLGGRPLPDGYRLATRAYRLAGRLGLPVLSLVDTPGAEPGTDAEQAGIAPAMGESLDALLTCPSPTLALVHGEGGSGGALAAAAADRVLVTPDAYFAAIGPEGAQAALRRPAAECAHLMAITPRDLLALGAADALVPGPDDRPDARDGAADEQGGLGGHLAGHLAALCAADDATRATARRQRWASPVPGTL
jgi:acetyl-CoA carboxylase alpha subunit